MEGDVSSSDCAVGLLSSGCILCILCCPCVGLVFLCCRACVQMPFFFIRWSRAGVSFAAFSLSCRKFYCFSDGSADFSPSLSSSFPLFVASRVFFVCLHSIFVGAVLVVSLFYMSMICLFPGMMQPVSLVLCIGLGIGSLSLLLARPMGPGGQAASARLHRPPS